MQRRREGRYGTLCGREDRDQWEGEEDGRAHQEPDSHK